MHLSLRTVLRAATLAAVAAAAALVPLPLDHVGAAQAATSVACDGGDFRAILPDGRVLAGYNGWKISPSALPAHSRVQIRGRYLQFDLDVSDFAVYDYALTGASNPLDMTHGLFTPLFASKVPDLKGATLDAGDFEIQLSPQSAVIRRRGVAAGMKIQAKDCAQGGVFQMEPDQQTVVTHYLADGIFYFKNPLTGKINFGNGADVIGKDSPQVATKLAQYGNASVWQIEAGGRMGMVLGEDAIELAPGAPVCTQQCQVQDKVQGSLPVPGGS
jgi:hypothetical protein